MSDVMLKGVLRMPRHMAMANAVSSFQFYDRAQEALDRMERAEAALQQIADMDPPHLRADDLGRAARIAQEALGIAGVEGTLKENLAAAIHYPDRWDQAAYPTLASALNELAGTFRCTNKHCAHGVLAASAFVDCSACGGSREVTLRGTETREPCPQCTAGVGEVNRG